MMLARLGRWAIERARGTGYALGFLAQVVRQTLLFFPRRRQVAF